jgi:uncharacterized protein (TIGR02147 family)
MDTLKSKISVFAYTDYRKYLADFYQHKKSTSNAFSYRYFARKAGINSVGLYKDVVEGRQNLGRALIMKFSAAIGHTRKEADYFENMVFFNEAKNAKERKLFFDRMISSQGSLSRVIDGTRYEYYQKWYYSAVRALISIGRFKYDDKSFRRVASILNPKIRPEQAKKAIDVLRKLNFISEDPDGFFVVIDSVITTGVLKPDKNVTILNVINYQKEITGLADNALDTFGIDNVNLSTLTLGISDTTKALIKEELASARNKISLLAEKDPVPDRVFQLNMQFFHLSDTFDGGER